MSRIGTIARRTFLIGSAAIVGGVVFGYAMYRRPHANPLQDDLAEGEAALTPYVRIDAEGVTLITPRADKGQGAYHVQAVLIAEELDVALDDVRIEPGPPSPAYYNTALSQEAMPIAATEEGWVAETLRNVMDAPMKFMGMQVTGGSTTVPDSFDKLRIAGAVARETLKQAASELSGINPTALKTEAGRVLLPGGEAMTYAALAPHAAQIEPVTRVRLREPSDWRLIGQPMQRLDIVPKSTGTQRYGIDVEIDGMVHAAVRANPRIGGEMRSFDASAAEDMRGVQQVVPVTGGVAVVADNTWRAIRAAEAIEVDWGPAPYPAEMDDHWATLADSFTEDRQDNRFRDEGDVTEALAADGAVIEAEYRAPYLAHAPLEPVNATVLVSQNRVDVWTGTQIPRFVQANVARMTGVPAQDVHVHVEVMGGSFGHRLEDTFVRQATEVAMALPGTPVKLTYSREEDTAHDAPRQIAMARLRGRVSGGQVEALDLGIAMPSIIASQMGRQGLSVPGPDAQIAIGAWDQPFAIPHYRVTGYRAPELVPISSWRSVGASSNVFFHDTALDELIHAAGADPMAERLRLCTHTASRAVLENVAEMSGWSGPNPAPGVGRGVAYGLSFGVPVAEVVEVAATEDGIRLDKVWVAADVGRIVDPVMFENQVMGGVIWGLGHAMMGEITFSDGMTDQLNFDGFQSLRLYQTPQIEVRGLETATKIRGIGEPPVPPAAPALGNAIFAATGIRLREMPFNREVDFV